VVYSFLVLFFLLTCWLYDPLRTLVSFTTDAHSSLLFSFFFHLFTFRFHKSLLFQPSQCEPVHTSATFWFTLKNFLSHPCFCRLIWLHLWLVQASVHVRCSSRILHSLCGNNEHGWRGSSQPPDPPPYIACLLSSKSLGSLLALGRMMRSSLLFSRNHYWHWLYYIWFNLIRLNYMICCQRSWCRGNILDLFSKGARLESQPEHQITWLRFYVVYLSPSRQIPQ
jgi:hypothetical protein